jgi:hypothetical protein
MYRKIIASYSANQTEPVNIRTFCGKKNAELLNGKAGGTYSYHYGLKN